MGSKSLLVLEGEENIQLFTGNEIFVIRNNVCSHQQVNPNLRFYIWNSTLVKPVSAFLSFFGAYTFNIKMSKNSLTI